ncbi:MAG: transcription antitermination factor NusB [Phycisphaerales bacterium]|nr:transcription antitermination factor NusB [Phycisphaerales bacterium]
MATPRDIRRLALLALYQLDACKGEDRGLIRGSLDAIDTLEEEGLHFVDRDTAFSTHECDKAFAIAEGAYDQRASADAVVTELAPDWPTHRQPVVDRAIIRLSYYEMHQPNAQPKAIVNEAVELAKAFSTENSPGFVNGVLDKVLKRVLSDTGAGAN